MCVDRNRYITKGRETPIFSSSFSLSYLIKCRLKYFLDLLAHEIKESIDVNQKDCPPYRNMTSKWNNFLTRRRIKKIKIGRNISRFWRFWKTTLATPKTQQKQQKQHFREKIWFFEIWTNITWCIYYSPTQGRNFFQGFSYVLIHNFWLRCRISLILYSTCRSMFEDHFSYP